MNIKNLLKNLKLAEGAISMILGALVVIVIGISLLNYFRGIRSATQPSPSPVSESAEEVSEPATGEQAKPILPLTTSTLPSSYKVEASDSLWKIALKFYGSGYNWVDIAKENSLAAPYRISVGQELKIPKVDIRQPLTASAGTAKGSSVILGAIISETYTVARGDNLWTICLRAYGDGFQWSRVAKENSLANPNLIHPGNVLKLTR